MQETTVQTAEQLLNMDKATAVKQEKQPEPWEIMLKSIVDFLNAPENNHNDGDREVSSQLGVSTQSKKLWAVLSALRGPDNSGGLAKAAITGLIRYRIGLMPFDGAGVNCSDKPKFSVDRRNKLTGEYDHFLGHSRKAFAVLGLMWDELNQFRQSEEYLKDRRARFPDVW